LAWRGKKEVRRDPAGERVQLAKKWKGGGKKTLQTQNRGEGSSASGRLAKNKKNKEMNRVPRCREKNPVKEELISPKGGARGKDRDGRNLRSRNDF